MKELLIKGAEVLLEYHKTSHRKTCYTLKLIKKDNNWTSIDSLITNKLFYGYLLEKGIYSLGKVNNVRREVSFGKSRFDIAFENQQHSFLIFKEKMFVCLKPIKKWI